MKITKINKDLIDNTKAKFREYHEELDKILADTEKIYEDLNHEVIYNSKDNEEEVIDSLHNAVDYILKFRKGIMSAKYATEIIDDELDLL